MKKKGLVFSVILALLLTVLMPTTAFAAKPLPVHAEGAITSIEDTVIGENVFPAGDSGRFRVVDRVISGGLSGDIAGDFILTYKANVDLLTQAGNLHGTLTTGDYTFKINGAIAPLEMVPTIYGYLPMLTITGHWSRPGGPGNGTFGAWVVFIPDEYGHVVWIIDSSFTMDGTL